MKSDGERGLSSPQNRQDDTGSNIIDSDCLWCLTTNPTLTDLPQHIDKLWSDKRFIVSEWCLYHSSETKQHRLEHTNINSAIICWLSSIISDSSRRGFVAQ